MKRTGRLRKKDEWETAAVGKKAGRAGCREVVDVVVMMLLAVDLFFVAGASECRTRKKGRGKTEPSRDKPDREKKNCKAKNLKGQQDEDHGSLKQTAESRSHLD